MRKEHELVCNRFLNKSNSNLRKAGWQLNIQNYQLFSYSQLIAEHMDDGRVRIYSSKYGNFSVTTNAHISAIEWMCRDMKVEKF